VPNAVPDLKPLLSDYLLFFARYLIGLIFAVLAGRMDASLVILAAILGD
jgi:hypothetical protein